MNIYVLCVCRFQLAEPNITYYIPSNILKLFVRPLLVTSERVFRASTQCVAVLTEASSPERCLWLLSTNEIVSTHAGYFKRRKVETAVSHEILDYCFCLNFHGKLFRLGARLKQLIQRRSWRRGR